ncbi:hypothetical protein V8E36_003514 [Tilletia maclaganii]
MPRRTSNSAWEKEAIHAQVDNCGLFDSMCTDQQISKRVKERRTDKSLMQFAQIIVPVNIGNTHWAATIVKPKELSFRFHDSMATTDRADCVFVIFRRSRASRAVNEVLKSMY